MNLGDSEYAKEVKISIHLSDTQKESLVRLLAEYHDVFVWEVGDMQGLILVSCLISCLSIQGSNR